MPDNKRQHYVPKFLLRQFSCDVNKKQINIINIGRRKIIQNASLGEQCYRDYFYGKTTEIEKSLASLEGVFSKVVKDILSTGAYDHRQEFHMTLMISLQKNRTLRAEEELNAMVDKLVKLAMHGKISEEILRGVRINFEKAITHQIGRALTLSPMLLDLKQFIIENRTSIPFVLSDNPVIVTNLFGRTRFRGRALDGMSKSGLQMLMPLSPKYAILLHDGNVYTTQADDNIIKVSREKIIDNINELQWVNAYKNVYFSPEFGNQKISQLLEIERKSGDLISFERLQSLDGGRSYRLNDKDEYAPPDEGVKSELVRVSSKMLSKDIRIDAVKVRSNPLFYDDNSMGSPKRDPIWCQIVEDFSDAMLSGSCKFNDIWSFFESHYLSSRIGPWHGRVFRRSGK